MIGLLLCQNIIFDNTEHNIIGNTYRTNVVFTYWPEQPAP